MKTKKRNRDESPPRVHCKRTATKRRRRQARDNLISSKRQLITIKDTEVHLLGASSPVVPCDVILSNCYDITREHCEILRTWLPNVTSLNMEFCQSLTDEDFTVLFGFQEKETESEATATILESVDFNPFSKLEVLNLSHTNIGDAGVATLALQCPNLKTLSIQNTRVSDYALSAVAQHCHCLTALDVSGCSGFGSYGIQLLSQERAATLKRLDVSDCAYVNDAVVPYLCHCPNLTQLGLRNTKISDRAVSALLRRLQFIELNLEGLPISDPQLLHLIQFQKNLQKLDISFCHSLSVAALKRVGELSSCLQELSLFGLEEKAKEIESWEGLLLFC